MLKISKNKNQKILIIDNLFITVIIRLSNFQHTIKFTTPESANGLSTDCATGPGDLT